MGLAFRFGVIVLMTPFIPSCSGQSPPAPRHGEAIPSSHNLRVEVGTVSRSGGWWIAHDMHHVLDDEIEVLCRRTDNEVEVDVREASTASFLSVNVAFSRCESGGLAVKASITSISDQDPVDRRHENAEGYIRVSEDPLNSRGFRMRYFLHVADDKAVHNACGQVRVE